MIRRCISKNTNVEPIDLPHFWSFTSVKLKLKLYEILEKLTPKLNDSSFQLHFTTELKCYLMPALRHTNLSRHLKVSQVIDNTISNNTKIIPSGYSSAVFQPFRNTWGVSAVCSSSMKPLGYLWLTMLGS